MKSKLTATQRIQELEVENGIIREVNRQLLAEVTDVRIENAHLRAELQKMQMFEEGADHDGT